MKSTKKLISIKNKEDLWNLLLSIWGNFDGEVKVTGYHSIKPAHQNDNIGTGTKLEIITGMNYYNLRDCLKFVFEICYRSFFCQLGLKNRSLAGLNEDFWNKKWRKKGHNKTEG